MAKIPIASRVTTAKLTANKGACLGMNSAIVKESRPRETARIAAQIRAGL